MTTLRQLAVAAAIALSATAMAAQETVSQRGATEDDFIAGLRVAEYALPVREDPDTASLQTADNGVYTLPGAHYHLRSVNANTYWTIEEGGLTAPVYDAAFPAESMANLFIFPAPQALDVPMRVTVIKHEPGEKEVIDTTVGQFMNYCLAQGCTPFWGIEEIDGDIMQGALFMLNAAEGYDHVLKITCSPADVIDGNGVVEARASLFVPTANVKNLYHEPQGPSGHGQIQVGR